jgi:hypothetical protein
VGIFAGGIILGGLLVWAIVGMGKSSPAASGMASSTETNSTKTNASDTAMTSPGGVPAADTEVAGSLSLTVSNQSAGKEVVVENPRVQQDSWLVVYESMGGKPGNILGAAMAFPQNSGKPVIIPLLRATTPGSTYLIGENIDNGDHVFSVDSDKKVTDQNGALATQSFLAR